MATQEMIHHQTNIWADGPFLDTSPAAMPESFLGFIGCQASAALQNRLKTEPDLGPYQEAWVDPQTFQIYQLGVPTWQNNDWHQWGYQ